MLEADPTLVNQYDSQGFTAVHWAAKKGDVDLLRLLYGSGAALNLPALTEDKMLPIHWASSDGRIGAIRFFLDHKQDVNAQDNNGCTPVVIAAQHNKANAVAFFVKNGADMTLTDKDGDSALHWAAYKGWLELVGLLSYCIPAEINRGDTWGHTPLHLAATKGHVEVAEYLLLDCRADAACQDKNGSTALDLSVKKNEANVEWMLRQFLAKSSIVDMIKAVGFEKIRRNLKYVTFIAVGYNTKEISQWAWRVVCASNFVGSAVSLALAIDANLSDLYWVHLLSTMVQCFWWLMFYLCLRSPGEIFAGRSPNTYEEALEAIGNSADGARLPSVCHTCHVCRPLRSKHCKVQRRCIAKFDHFCPFVGNTVGRDNYKFFVLLVASHAVCYLLFVLTVLTLYRRAGISWFLFLYSLYATCWEAMIGGLLHFHVTLMLKNLSTNEYMGVHKYAYLRSEDGTYDNPFDCGGNAANILDGLFPATESYYSREEVLRARAGDSKGAGGASDRARLLP